METYSNSIYPNILPVMWHIVRQPQAWASYHLPGTLSWGLRTRRECQKRRFTRHRLQREPLISDPCMHHVTCVTHVPWCMSGSLTRGGREKRRMGNSQFYVSDKRPIGRLLSWYPIMKSKSLQLIRKWDTLRCNLRTVELQWLTLTKAPG